MQEREHLHASQQTSTPTREQDLVPGHVSRSAALAAPEHPVSSGLLLRKAERDGNGVADGAEHAVASAATSSGTALPGAIQRKFEDSLGADLSSVRVHTGSESENAAQAVGAKAYTVGQDIHFGAGQFDPSSGAGEHLLAHEVAHTVQQQGSTPTRQNKLEVSSPGDAAEHEADRAADAMVVGRAAQVSMSSGVSRRAVHRVPTTDKSHPTPIRNPSVAVVALGQAYQTLMEKQKDGLDNLFNDYAKNDDPTVEDKALKLAVVAALSAATGLVAEPLVAAAVEAVVSRITAGAASKAIELGEQPLEDFLAAYKARTTAYTAKVQGWIKSGVAAGVGAVMKSGAKDPFESFYEMQRDQLRDLKQMLQDKVDASVDDFAGPAGIEMAQGIWDAVKNTFTHAIEVQYMTSLSEWSKIAKGKINGSLTLTVPLLWTRGGPISFTSAQISANDSIRNRLQQSSTISKRKLSDFPLPLTLKVTTPATFMHPESTWIATGSTVGMPTNYPTSDSGAYDLYRFATGQQYKDKNEVPFATGVTVGAASAFAALGELTWAQLPKLA